MKIRTILIWFCCLLMQFASALAEESDSISNRYISLALQGDLTKAGALFEHSTESNSAFDLSQQFETRFIEAKEDLSPDSGDALVDAVVSAYREYWILVLMGRLSNPEGVTFLEVSLQQIFLQHSHRELSGQTFSVFELLGELFDQKGIHYLDTPAPPLRDLFLWRSEENANYTVSLTDRILEVRVTFMTGIYSLGWKQYATLGLVSTTGWVEGGRLFCVEWAYDRNSENFEVSYLKHESRHLADFELFPALQSTDLEYRAKLTELVFASTTQRRLLDDFTNKSAPNPDSPHAYANYRVIRDVYREMFGQPFPESGDPWQEASTQSISEAANDLLRRNTESLQANRR